MAESNIPADSSRLIEDELDRHGVYASVTRGISMWPLFKTYRDMVIIKKPAAPLRKYDVVLYTGAGNHYTLHRIIAILDGIFVIRGDNTYRKEYVREENIIGVLTEFNRHGKRHTVDEAGFKLYSKIWHYLYPVRFLFYKLHCIGSKIKHKIFGLSKKN